MTVRELIERLRAFPDDRLVVIADDVWWWPVEKVRLETVDVVMGDNIGENDVSTKAVTIV